MMFLPFCLSADTTIHPPRYLPTVTILTSGGGPMQHRYKDALCRVCGHLEQSDNRGCPCAVNMHTYDPGKPLTDVREFKQAIAAFHAANSKHHEEDTD